MVKSALEMQNDTFLLCVLFFPFIYAGRELCFLASTEVCDRIESRSGLQETSLPGFCFPKSKSTEETMPRFLEGGDREVLLSSKPWKRDQIRGLWKSGKEREGSGFCENGQQHFDLGRPQRRMAAWFPDLINITLPQKQQKQWTQRDHVHLGNACLRLKVWTDN